MLVQWVKSPLLLLPKLVSYVKKDGNYICSLRSGNWFLILLLNVMVVLKKEEKKGLLFLPAQLYPSPMYPCLHVQLNDPWVLLHEAHWLQLCVPDARSLISSKINRNTDEYK